MPERLTNEIVDKRIADRPIERRGEYVHSNLTMLWGCLNPGCNHEWLAKAHTVLYANRNCPVCSSKTLNKETVNSRIANRGIKLIGEFQTVGRKARFQCSKDHEWITTPNSVLGGTGCLRCYQMRPSPKLLTKEIVNERLASRGIVMTGGYIHGETKTAFRASCGHEWMARPRGVQSGAGCPVCAGNLPLSKEIVNERIADRGIRLAGDYIASQTSALFECDCGHEWMAKPNNIVNGKGCAICSGVAPLSKEIVNERIAHRGVRLVGEYVNINTKSLFQCACTYEWMAEPANVIAARGCPACADYGYNPTKPGLLYYLRIEHQGATAYKIGITNRSVKERFNNTDLAKITVLDEQILPGYMAARLERTRLRRYAKHQYTGPDLLTSGNTELFDRDVLGLDKEQAA